MNHRPIFSAISVWMCIAAVAGAQEKTPSQSAPAPAGVEGIKGVKQEAVKDVKNIESGIKSGAKNDAQAVNKIDGVQTIDGVKAEGQTKVLPVQPPPVVPVQPPPPPAVHHVIIGAGSIQAVNGVTGINTAKLQNLEAALALKHDATGAPTGKGRAAAAGLLGAPGGKPATKPKDGRDGFQEFEKLKNAGS